MTRFGRYVRTIRHLRAGQIYWRARYACEGALPWRGPRADVRGPAQVHAPAGAGLYEFARAMAQYDPPAPEEVARLRGDQFMFLNLAVPSPLPIDWAGADLPRLAQFQLHSFPYARTLALQYLIENNSEDAERVAAWIRDWIDQNGRVRGAAWHPYVISSRLLNWSLACIVLNLFDEVILDSMARQAEFLSRHVEYDVRANHLIRNASALAMAGALLDVAAWRDHGVNLLRQELDEQILADGGHYEGSLMYHLHVLDDGLMVYATLPEKPSFLERSIDVMTTFLAAALHADGGIPLFGDAALHAASAPHALLAVAGTLCDRPMAAPAAGRRALPESGLYVMETEDGRCRMMIKAGWPAPDYQPGHSHCDWFSYEMTQGRRRVVVDSGVQGYEPGAWRDYSRSTRAHNTVQVNELEQMECWRAFRIGRRSRPHVEMWNENGTRLRAAHDGFRPYRHTREFRLQAGKIWIVADRIDGPGSCEAAGYVHFHPEVHVELLNGVWRGRHSAGQFALMFAGGVAVDYLMGAQEPLQGWYCPDFGHMAPAPCLVLRKQGPCPLILGYAIVPEPAPAPSCDDVEQWVRACFS